MEKKNKVLIYLADLTHTGKGLATEGIPLNIGLLKSYALSRNPNDYEIRLFKYPEKLLQALEEKLPDILGFSNYTWNHNLSYFFAEKIKRKSSDVLIIFGGTNYPFNQEKQEQFLKERPAIDGHVFYEGEQTFFDIIETYNLFGHKEVFTKDISGFHFYKNGSFKKGPPRERIKDLDSIPSPYSNGILDEFFDGELTPLLETTRGCPFRCNFCNAGDAYFTNVNKFSLDYIQEEINYVAQKSSNCNVGHMTLADNNFGMIPRDREVTDFLAKTQDQFHWPKTMTVYTGKNSKKRVIEATRKLGDTLSISMSVQALEKNVLKNIKRDNIKLDHFYEITNDLNQQGRPQHAELIIPLPGETWESHVTTLKSLLDTNIKGIQVHQLQLLYGTDYIDNDSFIKKWGYENKKTRIVPLDFGTYDGERIFDTEYVAVSTKSFSFEDYLNSRQLLLVIELCYNAGILHPLRMMLRENEIKISDWIMNIYANLKNAPQNIQNTFQSFSQETKNELWDNKNDLIKYFKEDINYQKLINGDAGANVLFKHKSIILSSFLNEFVDFIFINSKNYFIQDDMTSLTSLKLFIKCLAHESYGFSSKKIEVELNAPFDFLNWLQNDQKRSIHDYNKSTSYIFYFDEEQLKIKSEGRRRYGDGIPGIVKFLQRTQGSDKKLLRKIKVVQ